MQDHDDFSFEPVPGLPANLPKGEAMLWQGSPHWPALARSAFHVRKVAAYFGVLVVWQAVSDLRSGTPYADIAASCAWLAGGAAVAIAILCLLAWLYARGTIYTLSSRRLVMRSGLALPVTLNLPLSQIATASVSSNTDGCGSIALTVIRPNRIAWLVLWPNARPWRFTNPQPMLRCLKDCDGVAPTLARALEADAATVHGRPAPATERAVRQGAAAAPAASMAA